MNNYQFFEIYIKEPNYTLQINRKVLKTPLKARISSKQLALIKLMMVKEGITDYTITEMSNTSIPNQKNFSLPNIENIKIDNFDEHDVIVEEL